LDAEDELDAKEELTFKLLSGGKGVSATVLGFDWLGWGTVFGAVVAVEGVTVAAKSVWLSKRNAAKSSKKTLRQ
jgi:hypothetical protein